MSRYRNYCKEIDTSRLQEWLNKNQPDDKYYWKGNWWTNNVFIRDQILPLFSDGYELVGSHYSKSIECPVIKTTYKGVEIIWQYNFYDWQIMIKSSKPLILEDLSLLNADGDYFFYQGIPEEYWFKPYSSENNKEFAIDIIHDDIIEVLPFALALRKAIDKAYEEVK